MFQKTQHMTRKKKQKQAQESPKRRKVKQTGEKPAQKTHKRDAIQIGDLKGNHCIDTYGKRNAETANLIELGLVPYLRKHYPLSEDVKRKENVSPTTKYFG